MSRRMRLRIWLARNFGKRESMGMVWIPLPGWRIAFPMAAGFLDLSAYKRNRAGRLALSRVIGTHHWKWVYWNEISFDMSQKFDYSI